MLESCKKEMAAFYQALDADIATRRKVLNTECAGCGACCRFDQAGHVVYASTLERMYLLEVAKMPVAFAPEHISLLRHGSRCPYQVGACCSARQGRVLGCRLFFCQWPAEGLDEWYQSWHEQLQIVHQRFEMPWDYRPLFPLPEHDR